MGVAGNPQSALGEGADETVGIDLAASEVRTSSCRITWSAGTVSAEFLGDRDDDELVGLISSSRRVGLDCPLGWPHDFVAMVSAHHARAALPHRPRFEPRPDARRLDPLIHRLTDDITWKATGTRPPLSVSTNLLGVVALRAARLCQRVQDSGIEVDRSGAGVLAEVYPAAALRAWGIAPGCSYKTPSASSARAEILSRLETGLGTRFSSAVRERCIAHHDDLDALICAVIARAVDIGHTTWPQTEHQRARALTEGWIHLPNCSLAQLAATVVH